jgi:signal transduction histidine kinase
MAWIGYAENDAAKTVRKMAKTGYDQGYVDNAQITWSNTEYGRGPTGTAIRTKKPHVTRSILTDIAFLPWRNEALKRGYASTLGLPLISDDQVFGALTIYSERPDVFDEDEIVLLQELADNLAYGITSLRSQAKREQAERELKEAKAQSEMYLDLMGHDINNMNQIALGFLELAIDALPPDDRMRELIARPREALESSTSLINNVRRLQKAKKGSLGLHAIEVCSVLDKVIPRFENVAGREITIRKNYECECSVMANDLLDDVFANIIGNAIKHSKGALTIGVNVSCVYIHNKKFCRIGIEDNGPGIPDDLKNSLLTRFQRESKCASGKGLGLYLINTLVEDFHGRAWIENRVPGDHTKGSLFVVLLAGIDQ